MVRGRRERKRGGTRGDRFWRGRGGGFQGNLWSEGNMGRGVFVFTPCSGEGTTEVTFSPPKDV